MLGCGELIAGGSAGAPLSRPTGGERRAACASMGRRAGDGDGDGDRGGTRYRVLLPEELDRLEMNMYFVRGHQGIQKEVLFLCIMWVAQMARERSGSCLRCCSLPRAQHIIQ